LARQELRIIVEGMDGSGKSRLIQSLMDEFPELELIRNDLGPEQSFDYWWGLQLDREMSSRIPIHDRFFYSELVYGPILRGKINAHPNMVSNALWFLRLSAMLIYARPTTDRLRQGIKVEAQMEGVEDRFTDLLGLYDELMSAEMPWYSQRFIHYTWENSSEVTEHVSRYLNGELR
jgi:thymidylate kinase